MIATDPDAQAVMSDLCVEALGSTQRRNASFDIKAAVHDPGAAMREDRAGRLTRVR